MKRKIPFPVPLKHSTETAYLVLLGLVICTAGFAASLLPDLPSGLLYWLAACALSVAYPLVLSSTFRLNRADYEFRLLHWFPVGIFALWALLQFLAPRFEWMNIFKLGFLFLWSLPMVTLGLFLIMVFAVHVLRRSRIRVMILSMFFVLFTVGAVMAEGQGWNESLQANLFPPHAPTMTSLRSAVALVTYFAYRPTQQGAVVIADSSSSALRVSSVPSSKAPELATTTKPNKLPKSGAESALVLLAAVLALYAGTVHRRSQERASRS